MSATKSRAPAATQSLYLRHVPRPAMTRLRLLARARGLYPREFIFEGLLPLYEHVLGVAKGDTTEQKVLDEIPARTLLAKFGIGIVDV